MTPCTHPHHHTLFTVPPIHPAQGMQRQPGKPTLEEELERALTAAGAISPDNAGDFFKVPAGPGQGREGGGPTAAGARHARECSPWQAPIGHGVEG